MKFLVKNKPWEKYSDNVSIFLLNIYKEYTIRLSINTMLFLSSSICADSCFIHILCDILGYQIEIRFKIIKTVPCVLSVIKTVILTFLTKTDAHKY